MLLLKNLVYFSDKQIYTLECTKFAGSISAQVWTETRDDGGERRRSRFFSVSSGWLLVLTSIRGMGEEVFYSVEISEFVYWCQGPAKSRFRQAFDMSYKFYYTTQTWNTYRNFRILTDWVIYCHSPSFLFLNAKPQHNRLLITDTLHHSRVSNY